MEHHSKRTTTSSEILSNSLKYIEVAKESRASNNELRNETLAEVSRQLTAAGFSPLPAPLSQSNLSTAQVTAIKDTIGTILLDCANQSASVKKLDAAYAQSVKSLDAEQQRVQELERSRRASISNDSQLLAQMEESLQLSGSRQRDLETALSTTRAELIASQKLGAKYQETILDLESRLSRADERYADLESKVNKDHERAQAAYKDITSRAPGNSGVDRLVLQIIDVYENKLDLARASSSPLKGSMATTSIKAETNGTCNEIDDTLELQALLIKQLETELDTTKTKLQAIQEEFELSELRQLAVGNSTARISAKRSGSTRSLVQHDKAIHSFRTRLAGEFSLPELLEMFTVLADRIGVSSGSLEELHSGIDDVEKVLRLLPQMQDFIYRVTLHVWGDEEHLLQETLDRLLASDSMAYDSPKTDIGKEVYSWLFLLDRLLL